MAFVPIAIMVASAAMSAYGAMSASKAQAASYKSQQQAANYNATVNQQNAMAAEAAGSANELAERRLNDQRMGVLRARAAESGGGFTGTNVGALDQAAANMELDALNTRYRGTMQARGMLAQANLNEFQANVAGQNAGYATESGYFNAASGILSSAANYYNYRGLATSGGGYGG